MSRGAPMRLDPPFSKAEVSIAYIGPAVEEGRMDVRDLAPTSSTQERTSGRPRPPDPAARRPETFALQPC